MGQNRNARRETLEFEQNVLELALSGATYHRIARVTGHSVSGVKKAYERAMGRVEEELRANAHRNLAVQLARYHRLLSRSWTKATTLDGELGAKWMGSTVRIMERIDKLLGLEAPTTFLVGVTTQNALEQRLEETRERVEELQALPAGEEILDAEVVAETVQLAPRANGRTNGKRNAKPGAPQVKPTRPKR